MNAISLLGRLVEKIKKRRINLEKNFCVQRKHIETRKNLDENALRNNCFSCIRCLNMI